MVLGFLRKFYAAFKGIVCLQEETAISNLREHSRCIGVFDKGVKGAMDNVKGISITRYWF